jgi:DMSO/TMAO reductase YedYZ molybdopterin-dependent catalytic subunit
LPETGIYPALGNELPGASPGYGAPLRLCVEDQIGYKMVKWIGKIEFLDTHNIGKSYDGKNEDDENFDLLADT